MLYNKPTIYNTPKIYKSHGGVYNSNYIYNDGSLNNNIILDCEFKQIIGNDIKSNIGNDYILQTNEYSQTANGVLFSPSSYMEIVCKSNSNNYIDADKLILEFEWKTKKISSQGWCGVSNLPYIIELFMNTNTGNARCKFKRNNAHYIMYNGAYYDTSDTLAYYIFCPGQYEVFQNYKILIDYVQKTIDFYINDVHYIHVYYDYASDIPKPSVINTNYRYWAKVTQMEVKKTLIYSE